MSLLRRILHWTDAPRRTADDPDEPVVIAYPEGEEVDALWAGMLEGEGIRALVRDVSPLYRGYANWAREMELLVRRADAPRAREILGADARGVVRGRAVEQRTTRKK